jgi:hypothetical protein
LKEDMTQLELAIWNAKLMRKRGMTLVIWSCSTQRKRRLMLRAWGRRDASHLVQVSWSRTSSLSSSWSEGINSLRCDIMNSIKSCWGGKG